MNPLTQEEIAWLRRAKNWLWVSRVSEAVGTLAIASTVAAHILWFANGDETPRVVILAGWISTAAIAVSWWWMRLATRKIREIGDPP